MAVIQFSEDQISMAMSRLCVVMGALAVVLCLVACEARTHVRITNELRGHKKLTVHCKSKDDDLGFHDLSLGSTYEFTFKSNFWGTTLFFCSVKWDANLYYFDAYKWKYSCEHEGCNWKIRDEGACFYLGTIGPKCTPWK